MTEILLYAEVNILCIAVLIIIAIDIKKSEFNHGLRPTLLTKYIGCITSFYLLDILGKIISLKAVQLPIFGVCLLSIIYFLIFAVAAYIWFAYSEVLHNRQFLKNKRLLLLTAIPIFVLAMFFVASCFNGCIFYIDATGAYHRGKLFFVPAVISYGYIFTSACRCWYYATKMFDESKKRKLKNYVYYSFITVFFGLAQFWVGRFPLLIMGNTLSVLVMYLNYVGTLISNDSLTEIPNRRKLMHYLTESVKSLKQDEELWFMFIDIDQFKQINDRWGHMEGDRILKELTIVLKEFCRENGCFCARFGGDEFAIVQKQKDKFEFFVKDELEKFVNKKNILINRKSKLSLSIGVTKFSPDDCTVDDIIKRADKEMYRSKMGKTAIFGGGGKPSEKYYYN